MFPLSCVARYSAIGVRHKFPLINLLKHPSILQFVEALEESIKPGRKVKAVGAPVPYSLPVFPGLPYDKSTVIGLDKYYILWYLESIPLHNVEFAYELSLL